MTENQIQNQIHRSNSKIFSVGNTQMIAIASLGSLLFAASSIGFAWADVGQNLAGDIQIKATNNIKNDPAMMKVLYNIELFKQKYAAQQQRQQLQDQQQKLIDEQRKIANEYLQTDLMGMNNLNDQNNPRNSYAGFVSRVDSSAQNLFWDQFAFMQDKVNRAKLAMNTVLQNGGSMEDARQAYNNAASTQVTQLVDVNKELNVKYHLTSAKTQDLFNKYGNFRKYSAS